MKIAMRFLLLLLAGCSGIERGCASFGAESFGADWLIAQYAYDGRQIHCWKLHDRSVANEAHSDGIYWTSNTGHLVHVGGWYTRVQVANGDYSGAARGNNISLDGCK